MAQVALTRVSRDNKWPHQRARRFVGKRVKRRSPSARRRRRRPRWMQTTAAHSRSPSERCHMAGTLWGLFEPGVGPLCPAPTLFAAGRRRDNLSEPTIGRRRLRFFRIEAAEWPRRTRRRPTRTHAHRSCSLLAPPRYPVVLRAFAIRSARPFPPPPTPNHGGSVRYSRVIRCRSVSCRSTGVVVHQSCGCARSLRSGLAADAYGRACTCCKNVPQSRYIVLTTLSLWVTFARSALLLLVLPLQ